MDKYKHKSGALKRKERVENLVATQKLPKMDRGVEGEREVLSAKISSCTSLDENHNAADSLMRFQELESEEAAKDEPKAGYSAGNMSAGYTTDKGHYPDTLTDGQVKHFIVSQGSCKPPGPFPRDPLQGDRYFSMSFYSTTTKYGIQLPRSWLCYSPKLDAAYCEPCWLFADCSHKSYNVAWTQGIRTWQTLSNKISKHEGAECHVAACSVYDQWRLHGTIDEASEQQIREQVNFWRQVLDRIIYVTLTLASNNLAFRGHFENVNKHDKMTNVIFSPSLTY